MSSVKRLILDLETTILTAQEKKILLEPCVLGVILFARNIESREQVTALCEQVKVLRADLLICIDQEGGRVRRLRNGYTALPAMANYGEIYDSSPAQALEQIKDLGWLLGEELKASFIDFSFTPVLDLDYKNSQVIGDRAFHQEPEIVSELAEALIEGLHSAGVACCGKHYPGHGWVAADSHLELPCDDREFEAIFNSDLLPFRNLAPQLDSIMPAHVVYQRCDKAPAGFSSYWLDYLKKDLAFAGVVFSDDLAMAGAAATGSYAQRAEQALSAGCDVVLVCNDRAGAIEVITYLNNTSWEEPPQLNAMFAKNRSSWKELLQLERYVVVQEKIQNIGT